MLDLLATFGRRKYFSIDDEETLRLFIRALREKLKTDFCCVTLIDSSLKPTASYITPKNTTLPCGFQEVLTKYLKQLSKKKVANGISIKEFKLEKCKKKYVITGTLVAKKAPFAVFTIGTSEKRYLKPFKNRFTALLKSIFLQTHHMARHIQDAIVINNLKLLNEIARSVHEFTHLDKLLRSILATSQKVLAAEASSIAVVDNKTNSLIFTTAYGQAGRLIKKIRIPLGIGVIGKVAQTGIPRTVNDAKACKDFYPKIDVQTGFKTRSILCVPLLFKNKPIGAIEMLNKQDKKGFSQDDFTLLKQISEEVSAAIKNAKLLKDATTDSLTDIFLMRYFQAALHDEYARARKYHLPLSLLLCDVDDFKQINDTLGHQTGNRVLKEVANQIKKNCREMDIVARYGGDEFIVLLPDKDIKKAELVAKRLRSMVAKIKLKNINPLNKPLVTLSIGLTQTKFTPKDTTRQLIKRADEALYNAKRKGKNRVCTKA